MLLYISLVLTSFLIMNCSSDDLDQINDEKLYGVWIEDFTIENINQLSRLEYRFNTDNTYEVLRIRIDNNTSEILGYRYRELGNFSLKGNSLFFTDIKRYTSDNNGQEEFSDIENLQLVNLDFDVSISEKIEFRNNERILAFIPPPCPPNASCVKPPVLEKQ